MFSRDYLQSQPKKGLQVLQLSRETRELFGNNKLPHRHVSYSFTFFRVLHCVAGRCFLHFYVQTVQVAHLSAADLPVLSVRLPSSAPCGVGSVVTSARNSVNRGEHVDQVERDQQGGETRQRHVRSLSLYCATRVFTQLGYIL